MDIQAYFEEWSCKPGDVARLAISTPHKEVRATLVRLVSGPGQAGHREGRVVDFSSVLDRTVPGRLQSTMIGSYAKLPLPTAIGGRAISIHCWAWPTVPDRETPQAIWSLGDIALVIAAGRLALRVRDETLVTMSGVLVAKHWYSILVTIGDGTASIDLKRLDGKINAHQTISAATGASATADRLLLAASGIDPTGSPLQPYNGKIDSPTLHLAQPSVDSIAAWHAGTSPALFGWAAWKLSEDFAAETIAPDFAGGTPAVKLFDGVSEMIVGDYGHVLGGAVGDEVDRFDIALGSPEHAYLLGTSTGLGNEYQLVIEDLTLSLPDQGGAQRPDMVRADMVLFPIDGGGWVFSVGSITYGGALAWNGCDNDLSRLTENVLVAFTGEGPVLGER